MALVAHHIKPKSLYPELKLKLSNGETLCCNCHAEHHKMGEPIPKGERCALKKAAKRTKLALLRAENSALKAELYTMRNERAAELTDRAEMAALRAELAEYEVAYEQLTAWPEPAS